VIQRDKLTGVALLAVSLGVLIAEFCVLIRVLQSGSLYPALIIGVVSISIVSLGMTYVGCMLLIWQSERVVALVEIRRRVRSQLARSRKHVLPFVIYTCGIDGAGKTTQIALLAKCLQDQHLRFEYVWLRWVAFISYPFLAVCRLLGYTKWKLKDNGGVRYVEHSFHQNRAISRLWTWLFVIDMLGYSVARVRIPLVLRRTVLCDRFVIDALVDLICETGQCELAKHTVGRLLLSLLPRDSCVILLDVAPDQAYGRKSDIPNVNYLAKRRAIYMNLAHRLNLPIVDGSRTCERVHGEIVEQVLRCHPTWCTVFGRAREDIPRSDD
jgi:thymidylate kinase